MSINKKFKLNCPNCGMNDKIISKCKICRKSCCSLCSYDYKCVDCFIDLTVNNELKTYISDKKLLKINMEV